MSISSEILKIYLNVYLHHTIMENVVSYFFLDQVLCQVA
jgi:hypothetical protein